MAFVPTPRWSQLERNFERLLAARGREYFTKELQKKFQVDIIYVSSNLEGIDVSWWDVEEIVTMYPGPPRLDLRDHAVLQAIGQKEAFEILEQGLVSRWPDAPGPEVELIKEFHFHLMREV